MKNRAYPTFVRRPEAKSGGADLQEGASEALRAAVKAVSAPIAEAVQTATVTERELPPAAPQGVKIRRRPQPPTE